MSATDPEWNDLMDAWQSENAEEASPPPLSEEVRRRIRRKVKLHGIGLILLAISEVAVSAGALAWMLPKILERQHPVDLVGFAGVSLLFAVSLAFVFWNRRGTWWPAAESTRTFLDLSIERCRRKLLTLRYCPGFLAVEVVFIAIWGTWALLDRPEPASAERWIALFGILGLVAELFLYWIAWYKKRTLRELAEFEELRRSLGDEEA